MSCWVAQIQVEDRQPHWVGTFEVSDKGDPVSAVKQAIQTIFGDVTVLEIHQGSMNIQKTGQKFTGPL